MAKRREKERIIEGQELARLQEKERVTEESRYRRSVFNKINAGERGRARTSPLCQAAQGLSAEIHERQAARSIQDDKRLENQKGVMRLAYRLFGSIKLPSKPRRSSRNR
jgi:hypothetical protein